MKILILGATGLIGRMLYTFLSLNNNFHVSGLSRSRFFDPKRISRYDILPFDFFNNEEKILQAIDLISPNLVINCAGVTKHIKDIDNIEKAYYLNAKLPHILAKICELRNIRLIQISTDCVFSGRSGSYTENFEPDGEDLYSQSKFAGELGLNHLTLRVSTVGPELNTSHGLLDWFLSTESFCQGYRLAFFSGITSLEFAKILTNLIIPNKNLTGLYHISSRRISKYNLLRLITIVYGKNIKLYPNRLFAIDRSLDCSKFKAATGYSQKPFSRQLIELKQFTKEHNLHD